jgi:hypothetical protein
MSLRQYFQRAQGIGVLATTDGAGQIDQALYAKPLFPNDDETMCVFVMANRLTHDNLRHNPSAAYLFLESGDGNAGKRLSLTVIGEETEPEKLKAAYQSIPTLSDEDCRYLVYFHIDGVRPLVGNG